MQFAKETDIQHWEMFVSVTKLVLFGITISSQCISPDETISPDANTNSSIGSFLNW